MITGFKEGNTYYNNDVSVLYEAIELLGNARLDSYNSDYERHLNKQLKRYTPPELKRQITKEDVEDYYKLRGFTELIFKVTDECNLRCKYCVYSDHYPYTTSYGKTNMKFDVAQKAIDYYMESIARQEKLFPGKRPFIAFYGGEPLMNFQLIRECISYVRQNYGEYNVYFTITTNGLLLRDPEICEFLKENNVIICLSLDGYEENHDRNRVKLNAAPTYQEILSIVRTYFSNYPLIYTLCCIDYKTDPIKLYEFYMKNDRMQGGEIPHLLRISRINDTDTDYYNQFTSEDIQKYISGLSKLEEMYLESVTNNEENWFLDMMVGQELLRIYDRPRFTNLGGYYYVNGCCIPGEKIFVLPDGQYGVCEKVCIDDLYVGNVEQGLDCQKIADLMNHMNELMKERCNHCECSSLCTVCYANLTDKDTIGFSEELCEAKRRNFRHSLRMLNKINEINPGHFESRIEKNTYNSIRAEDTIEELINIMLS